MRAIDRYHKNPTLCGFVAGSISIFHLSVSANGAAVINITQVGPNVLAAGSGSLTTTELFMRPEQGLATGTNPANGFLGIGAGFGSYYETISGPDNFGSGLYSAADSATGDKFGMGSSGTWLLVPDGYVSGAPLSGTATWTATTIASMQLTPGTYLWTWGAGATADSLTLNIGVVPEPSSAILLGCGIAGLALHRRRKPDPGFSP